MIHPEPHSQELLRLDSLNGFAILDTPAEKQFDEITALAAEITNSPIALISFIDEKRQWFKSHHGLAVRETAKEYAFCAHAINSDVDIFIIEDTRLDPRFKNNPFVIGYPHVVFYAGVPIFDENELPLGTLCIIDNKPRSINTQEKHTLKTLCEQVTLLLNNRKLISNLEKELTQLDTKNKNLEKFAYLMAHDLKSPLINISAISKHISSCHAEDLNEEGKTLVSLLERSSNKLKELIDDILNYYVDGNKIQEEMSSITLHEFYTQIFELYNYDSSHELKLQTTLDRITFNRSILHQIMTNLISNAIRYNDKKKVTIEVGVSENTHSLEFYVQDNGPGIPLKHQEKVFELFKIGQKSDKKGEKGRGIGLATVKKLVESLGGTIWIENGKQNGCKFIFRIPNILKPLNLN